MRCARSADPRDRNSKGKSATEWTSKDFLGCCGGARGRSLIRAPKPLIMAYIGGWRFSTYPQTAYLDEHNLNAYSLFGSEESLMEMMAPRELLQC
jgi:hypothetical protein